MHTATAELGELDLEPIKLEIAGVIPIRPLAASNSCDQNEHCQQVFLQ
jgi:hypothetical protein